MTQLEQTLLSELEKLEAEREQEKIDAFQERTDTERRFSVLTEKYTEGLIEIVNGEKDEENAIVTWLKILSDENRQISELLKTPPKGKDLQEELEKVLQPLFEQLQVVYEKSNEALLSGIQKSLV
jgi:hypothetical protein